mgnify:FL=1
MKKINIVKILVLLVLTGFVACSGGEWVAKVEGEKISLDYLNTAYYAQHKQLFNLTKEDVDKYAADPETSKRLPTLNKSIFLDELIKQKLIYNKAVEEGYMKNKEVQVIMDIAKEGAVVQYYIKEKFKDEITPNEKEVEEIYAQQKDKAFRGVPIDQALKRIRSELAGRKLNMKLMECVENLKEVGKIEKNKNYKDLLKANTEVPAVKKDEKKEEKKAAKKDDSEK